MVTGASGYDRNRIPRRSLSGSSDEALDSANEPQSMKGEDHSKDNGRNERSPCGSHPVLLGYIGHKKDKVEEYSGHEKGHSKNNVAPKVGEESSNGKY